MAIWMGRLERANQARDRAIEAIDTIHAEFSAANIQKPLADRQALANDWVARMRAGTSSAIILYQELPRPPDVPAASEEIKQLLTVQPLSIDLLNNADANVAQIGRLLVDASSEDPSGTMQAFRNDAIRTNANFLRSQSTILKVYAGLHSEGSVERHLKLFQVALGFSYASIFEFQVGDISPQGTKESLLFQIALMRENVRLGKAAVEAEQKRYLAIMRDRSFAADDRDYSRKKTELIGVWLLCFEKADEIANRLEQAAEVTTSDELTRNQTLPTLMDDIYAIDMQLVRLGEEIQSKSRAL